MVRRISVMLVLAGVLAGGTTIPAAHAATPDGVAVYRAEGFSIRLGDQTCWIGTLSKRLGVPPANPTFGSAFICASPLVFLRDRASRIAPRQAVYAAFLSDGSFVTGIAPVVVLANRWVFPGVNVPGSTSFFPGAVVGALQFHGHRADGTLAIAGL